MITISKSYDLKWQYKHDKKYQWSKCGKLFNTQRNKEIKKIVNARCVGYCLNGKFKSLTSIRLDLELIPKILYPF